MQSDTQTEQFITRAFEIDVGHRVMHERVKCYSMHGHRVKIELTFVFSHQAEIGYAIDFKEIKRIAGQWLEDTLDHGFMLNPQDTIVLEACQKTGSKYYLMSLAGSEGYCNPTAENIAREIFMAVELLFVAYPALMLHQVRYYETPNCWVDTTRSSILAEERTFFMAYRGAAIQAYAKEKGVLEYDSRRL